MMQPGQVYRAVSFWGDWWSFGEWRGLIRGRPGFLGGRHGLLRCNAKFPQNDLMIRLDNVSKQAGHQILFIEAFRGAATRARRSAWWGRTASARPLCSG